MEPGRPPPAQLRELSRTGISVIEMMPIADFPGEFGWGYDGVDFFAPCHLYGTPDDLRAFVNAAHSLGMGVILDIVYNHFGPDGNYLTVFSDAYFTKRHKTDWGTAINFDGPDSGPVREFFISNARYWIEEFHFDGFRLDATQSIFDKSEEHILAAIGKAARAAAGERAIVLVAENEPQETKLIRPRSEGGYGLGRPLERRPPSLGDCRADRTASGLLHRLPGHAAGVHLSGEAWLPLPGSALRVAEAAARHPGPWPRSGGVRGVHRES